jgi:hypothetical protein
MDVDYYLLLTRPSGLVVSDQYHTNGLLFQQVIQSDNYCMTLKSCLQCLHEPLIIEVLQTSYTMLSIVYTNYVNIIRYIYMLHIYAI